MVRFEDNSLLQFYSLQSVCVSHISLCGDKWSNHVTVFCWRPCSVTTKACWREGDQTTWQSLEGDSIKETKDEVRFGVVEDGMRMSLSDTGWLRLESAVYTSRGVDSLGRQALRETSGAGPFGGRPKSSPSGQVFTDNVPDIKVAHFSE